MIRVKVVVMVGWETEVTIVIKKVLNKQKIITILYLKIKI